MGLPVVLSQTIIVSLWLVIPTEIIDENCIIESETNSVKTKVVDSCQNLVAIGHIMWENEASYFHPIKVFV